MKLTVAKVAVLIMTRLNARSWGASKCAIRHLGPTMTASEVVPFTLVFLFFAREISFWRKIHAGAHASSSLFLYLSSIPFHSHNALNLLSSATDKVNRGGRPPTRRKPAPFRRPAPPRRAACSSAGGMTSVILKPAARSSLELMIIGSSGIDASTSC